MMISTAARSARMNAAVANLACHAMGKRMREPSHQGRGAAPVNGYFLGAALPHRI